MIPLPTTQLMLSWLLLLQNKENSMSWKKICFTSICVGITVSHVIASGAFALKYMPIDIGESFYALYAVCCWTTLLYMFVVAFHSRYKITLFFDELSNMYNENVSKISQRFLVKANKKTELIWKIYFRLSFGYIILAIFLCFASILSTSYKHGHFDRNFSYVQFNLRLPWNVHKPLGYMVETLFGICICEVYLVINGTILLMFVFICMHHRAFYQIFKHSLSMFNADAKRQNHKEILCQLISFHNSSKALFYSSVEIYSSFVLVVLVGTMIGLACLIFQLDLEFKHPNTKIIFLLIGVVVTTTNLFWYSYFGLMATESYERMAQCLFESDWIGCSIELQHYFILMIQNTNRSIHFNGFGLIILNLETFTKLIKTVFTYYMVLKAVVP